MTEELLIKISAQIADAVKDIQKVQGEVKDLDKDTKSASKGFNDSMKTIGDASTKALKVVGAAVGVAAGALLALAETTAEYRTEQAKLQTAFEAAGSDATQATQTYNDLYRVLGDSGVATEAAGHLAQLTTNQADLAQWTTITQGVYATFGDSLPIESLTEAANETAKTGALTGALADALNWAGVAEEEFQAKLDACSTEAEREALIRGTLNGVYADAAAKYEENASAVLASNEAQGKLNEATAALGEALAPVMAELKSLAADVLAKISPYVQDFTAKYGPEMEGLLDGIADVLGKVIGFVVDNWQIISAVAGVILAIVAAINLYNAAMAIYNVLMAPVNVTIIAIVAAITALIAIIVLCVKHWDDIKAAAISVWEKIKEVWGKVASWFGELWTKIKNTFSQVGTFFKDKFKSAVDSVKSVFSSITSFFSDVWSKIKNIFSKVGSTIGNAITNTVKSAINGVLSTAIKIINGFISAINIAIGVINAIPGVNISKLSKLSVPKLAEGGIITGESLFIGGEGGKKEAVLPLEQNTEWMNILADRIAERNGAPSKIVLMLDGKELGQATINSINNITRQTGALQLVLA